jgi:hypothetical protein
MTADDYRSRIVDVATGEVGSKDAPKYEADAYNKATWTGPNVYWCGCFCLWVLHRVGLCLDWKWECKDPNYGFLFRLKRTTDPKPGDFAYFNHAEHHAVVARNNGDGTVDLINGNGAGGKVSLSTCAIKNVSAFYSTEDEVQAAAAKDAALSNDAKVGETP